MARIAGDRPRKPGRAEARVNATKRGSYLMLLLGRCGSIAALGDALGGGLQPPAIGPTPLTGLPTPSPSNASSPASTYGPPQRSRAALPMRPRHPGAGRRAGGVRPIGPQGDDDRHAEIGWLADQLSSLERKARTDVPGTLKKMHTLDQVSDRMKAQHRINTENDVTKKQDKAVTQQRVIFDALVTGSPNDAALKLREVAQKSERNPPPIKDAWANFKNTDAPEPGWMKMILNILKNTLQAYQDFDDHGGIGSVHIPREYEDGEVGTNAWPVPSWWSRVPAWWDRAPTWWTEQTKKWAANKQISGQFEADLFNAVNE